MFSINPKTAAVTLALQKEWRVVNVAAGHIREQIKGSSSFDWDFHNSIFKLWNEFFYKNYDDELNEDWIAEGILTVAFSHLIPEKIYTLYISALEKIAGDPKEIDYLRKIR